MSKLRKLMNDNLELRGLSPTTIKEYLRQVSTYANYYKKSPDKLGNPEVREYLLYLIKDCKLSSSSVNKAYCAIKFLYEDVLGDFKVMRNIPKIKSARVKMPLVLSKTEIRSIFSQIQNLKYLAILKLIYSAGLRISEATNLSLSDIDSRNMRIHVRCGKGAKERYTKLSDMALKTLRDYWHNQKPKDILFPGIKQNKPIHIRSVGMAFKQARIKANITKPATVHTLRHSFATHLLDQGENLHTIQILLGHSSIRSTVIYLHVSLKQLEAVNSPLDCSEFRAI